MECGAHGRSVCSLVVQSSACLCAWSEDRGEKVLNTVPYRFYECDIPLMRQALLPRLQRLAKCCFRVGAEELLDAVHHRQILCRHATNNNMMMKNSNLQHLIIIITILLFIYIFFNTTTNPSSTNLIVSLFNHIDKNVIL